MLDMRVGFMEQTSEKGCSIIARMQGHFERYPAIGESMWLKGRIYIVKEVIWQSMPHIDYILVPKEPERREVDSKLQEGE